MKQLVKMAAFFALYHSAYTISNSVLTKTSRWYRSLDIDKKRFVRAYIVRMIWAGQSTATALLLYKTLITGKGILMPEVNDILRGWSASFESWAYPSTLAFAAFENYIEFRHLVAPVVAKLIGINPEFRFQMPNVLQMHHILFFLVEAYSYNTRSIAFICNIVKIYELTAPFSFLCWVIKERIKFQSSQTDTIKLATVAQLEKATLARMIVWVLCRFAPDSYIVYTLYCKGLMPPFVYMFSSVQQNQHKLLWGNKIQLWTIAPFFVFWLHPYWFAAMVRSYRKLSQKKPEPKIVEEVEQTLMQSIEE